jgi:hypothetical protein
MQLTMTVRHPSMLYLHVVFCVIPLSPCAWPAPVASTQHFHRHCTKRQTTNDTTMMTVLPSPSPVTTFIQSNAYVGVTHSHAPTLRNTWPQHTC